jgi:predicted cupin superfamily sugar epimerase
MRAYSVIYALFTPEDFSALHMLERDEIWCWHAGDPLESLRLHPDGRGEWVKLGPDLAVGQTVQDVVPARVWQGTRLVPGGRWSLVSCIMAPEFVWEEFTLGDRAELSAVYPDWEDAVASLTRNFPPEGRR